MFTLLHQNYRISSAASTMAIVTLLTDSGEYDHYVAAIKAKILSTNPSIRVIDISHKIAPCDIGHAAFVLKSVFRDFPKGTIHLVAIDSVGKRDTSPIALQVEDHYFIGADNGLFGLITDKAHQYIAELNTINPIQTTFPEKDIFATAAAKLASGVSLTDLGKPMNSYKRMIDRQVKATKRQITGSVVRVDNYGNLITNIPRDAFDTLSQGKVFTVQFGGEKFRRINNTYFEVEEGDCFILFNNLGLLEIGVNRGNASELFGLEYDGVVTINFEE